MDRDDHEQITAPEADRIRLLQRPFDPTAVEAEEQYDAVVRRVNRLRARRSKLTRELHALEGPFLDGQPTVRSGPRRGQPLTRTGRRRRLARLVDVGVELRRTEAEERYASECLDRMNQALDAWARETYGG